MSSPGGDGFRSAQPILQLLNATSVNAPSSAGGGGVTSGNTGGCGRFSGPPFNAPSSARQEARPHQEFVDRAGALPAFADRPDDQRLAAPHVAGGEDRGYRGLIIERVGGDIAARVELDPGLVQHPRPARPEEPHRQQY